MTPFQAFVDYLALKSHFNAKEDGYNYFKYNGKIKATSQQFEKRKDRYFFKKLVAQYPTPTLYLAVNMVDTPSFWIGEINDMRTHEKFQQHQKIMQSLSYTFRQQFQTLKDEVEKPTDLIAVTNNEHPYILKQYMAGRIAREVFIVFLFSLGVIKYWDNHLQDKRWQSLSTQFKKFHPFLEYNGDNIKKISKEVLVGR